MGLVLLCLAFGYAYVLVHCADALLAAVSTGVVVHHAGESGSSVLCAGIEVYVAADHLLSAMMKWGGGTAFVARLYGVSAAGLVFGMIALFAIPGEGISVSLALFMTVLGAMAGALMADRYWRALA